MAEGSSCKNREGYTYKHSHQGLPSTTVAYCCPPSNSITAAGGVQMFIECNGLSNSSYSFLHIPSSQQLPQQTGIIATCSISIFCTRCFCGVSHPVLSKWAGSRFAPFHQSSTPISLWSGRVSLVSHHQQACLVLMSPSLYALF